MGCTLSSSTNKLDSQTKQLFLDVLPASLSLSLPSPFLVCLFLLAVIPGIFSNDQAQCVNGIFSPRDAPEQNVYTQNSTREVLKKTQSSTHDEGIDE